MIEDIIIGPKTEPRSKEVLYVPMATPLGV